MVLNGLAKCFLFFTGRLKEMLSCKTRSHSAKSVADTKDFPSRKPFTRKIQVPTLLEGLTLKCILRQPVHEVVEGLEKVHFQ